MFKHKLAADEVEAIAEIVPNGDNLLTKVKKWVDRSEDINNFKLKTAEGIYYGKRAAKDLLSANGVIAQKLGINMADYHLFREVQLWVNAEKTEYMIADIVLVKYDAGGRIADLILLENKLSGSTANTIRQNQGFTIIGNGGSLEVKAGSRSRAFNENSQLFIDAQNVKTLNSGIKLNFAKDKTFKISDEGNKEGNFDVNQLNFK
ncbi:hypothetical protein ACFOG5_08935 [Pedobacter fastidiosus]|uniref:Uncharacterized protein n=1 Tax=Pedobacter fastidiosus TaxID=2765361 RepID=A0ABR7KTD7_9SPHI|nr:hypothetical protein [Pedobacter fastidiosus]MBC6111317.1 hypothetical protein [Pedobacter fastidiosus]